MSAFQGNDIGREEYSEHFIKLVDNCITPSLEEFMQQSITMLIINILFNFIVRIFPFGNYGFHALSSIMGLTVMWNVFGSDILLHLFLIVMGYTCLNLVEYLARLPIRRYRVNPTYLTQICCALFLIYSEFFYENTELWLKSRGIAMIAVMKIITLADEFNRNTPFPDLVEFSGYVLCPANCIYGPWMKFEEYEALREVKNSLNMKWFMRIVRSLLIASFCLSISNCLTDFFIPEDSNRWLNAFKKAVSFRTSHYFVSYFSEAIMVTAGYNEHIDDPQGRWSYTITKPLDVELPRSLAVVVVSWNVPMHRFLKLFVYIPHLRGRGRPVAVLVTFFYSALLHGMNIEIALVLLSLGGFSYIQSLYQRFLSNLINACVKIHPCVACNHRFKRYHIITLAVNFVFMYLNVWHLAYLGSAVDIMNEQKSFYNTFLKWDSLDMASHHIFFFIFSCCCLFGNFLD